MVTQISVFGRQFSKMNQGSLSLQRKQLTVFVAMIKFILSGKMYNFRKLEPDSFPILNDFFYEISGDNYKYDFLKICYDKKSTLEDLYNSPKPIFSK